VRGGARGAYREPLPPGSDRHVLAVAIHIGADYIVTFNLDDFPAAQLDPLAWRPSIPMHSPVR
jgi:hypothetical protein